ncbi:MAG TPA: DUF3617 domain-containing protein [Thermoanaerobaculia bacterium]|jgi:hypothetical protein|nr:DUF3617 domain-containing protein [Thermoanaerobaculia bacterium]
MRKFVPYVFAAVIGFIAVVPAGAAENPHKPGKWQIAMQMEMPGMPFKIPAIKTEVCLTEEDLKDPQKAVPNDPKSKCTISDYKVDGNTVSWSVDCPKQNTKGTGEVTFTDENNYSGFTKMTVGEQEMKTKYTGKWLGNCSK